MAAKVTKKATRKAATPTPKKAKAGGKRAAARKPAGAKAKRPAGAPAKSKSRKPSKSKPAPAEAAEAAEEGVAEFAVAFIDGDGEAHVGLASAPDPAAAVGGLLEQAVQFEEPWLEDLVAVMVSHPSTWQAVQAKVLKLFQG